MSAGGLAGFPPAGAEDLKPLVAFLKRAEEMDGRDPIISYFCTLRVGRGGGHWGD